MKLDYIRELVSGYHNPEITKKIADAFSSGMKLEDSNHVWERIADVVNYEKPFTLGLSGEIKVAWNTITVKFPHIVITNQLTNPFLYQVRRGWKQTSILMIDQTSFLYTSLENILRVKKVSDRSDPDLGIDIMFRRDKKGRSSEEELFLHGIISSGFLLSHKYLDVHSININDFKQFLSRD